MKRYLVIATLVLAAATVATADRYAASQGSMVKVKGTSTLHEWTMESSTINGEIDASSPEIWKSTSKAVVVIPVTSLKSEHSKMDKLMAESLKADKFPQIRFELTEALPQNANGNAFTAKTRGKLTIAGVTKDVTLDVQGARDAAGRYTITGQAPIRMTAFGIKPPTAMMNTIKTGDDVQVSFRWVVAKTN